MFLWPVAKKSEGFERLVWLFRLCGDYGPRVKNEGESFTSTFLNRFLGPAQNDRILPPVGGLVRDSQPIFER
jgi:hypothetical protein